LEAVLKLDRQVDRFFTGKAWRVGTTALLIWATIFEPISAQTPQPPGAAQTPTAQAPGKVYSLSDLEYLLSPIALYPDPLLTLVLQASTFPEARLAILHRLGLNRCCEIAGRASAIVAFVGMVSLILVATAADVLH